MSQALYRKWRPRSWDEVVGQDHVIQTLRHAVRSQRLAHAYLFAGPRGTGKTTTARLLAKAANCLADDPAARPCNACAPCQAINEGRFLDLIEIDAASNTSVDDVRDLRDKINFSPNEGRYKVYIVDEVHMLSTAAFNALLKTLEEPPSHVLFILATTEVHKIPATVLSRCQRHEFRRVPVAVMIEHLRQRCEAEGLNAEPSALALIARQATGSLRDAISLLDQLASTDEKVTLERAEQVLGTASGETVRLVAEAISGGQVDRGLTAINRGLDGGVDPRQLARQIVDFLRNVLLIRMGNEELVDAPEDVHRAMTALASSTAPDALLAGIRAFSRAAHESRAGWQPGLGLELALLEAASPPSVSPAPSPAPAPRAVPSPRPAGSEETRRTKPASTQTTGTEAAPRLSLQAVLERWPEVLKAAHRLDPRTQALLNSCRPLGVQDGRLILGFSSEILREKMEKGHSLAFARQAVQEIVGSPLGIRCVISGQWKAADPNEAPAAPMDDEGMVATAVRELGGHVVQVQPLPPETNA
ncbi:MAG TPA: DNA polymerase III subunit gamma/tau [Anaerolineales bacterium]|nr:DNA polymerase III subunit gamma/tau [Anaerolineales bacterium]